jgi:hypothetical protein
MAYTYKITLGGRTFGDNRFFVWRDVTPLRAFDTRAEAEAAVVALKADDEADEPRVQKGVL